MSKLLGTPRRFALPAVVALSVTALSLALVACGGGKSTDGNDNASADTTATVSASPTAVATGEAPPAFRTDCDAIRGTPFASPDEANWYRENCARNDGPKVAAQGGSQVPIGDTLIIPAAGVEAPVSRTTVPESGAMPDPSGYFNAVWYDFSKFDHYGGYANAGNLILSGHVDCAHCVGDPNGKTGSSGTAVFWNIRKLKVGDTAQYKTADGEVINYVVVSSDALSVNSDWDKIVASSTADMTLITCTGTFSGGEYNQRHVVALKKV
jgi:LPXTG-site transpeptidase (sortase) family protein